MHTHTSLCFSLSKYLKSRPIQPKHWREMTNVVFYTESPTLFSACEKGRHTAGTGNSGVRACIIKTRTLRPVEAEFARRLSSREVVAFPRGSCIVWRLPLKKALFSCLVVLAVKGEKLWPVMTIIPFVRSTLYVIFTVRPRGGNTYG